MFKTTEYTENTEIGLVFLGRDFRDSWCYL